MCWADWKDLNGSGDQEVGERGVSRQNIYGADRGEDMMSNS